MRSLTVRCHAKTSDARFSFSIRANVRTRPAILRNTKAAAELPYGLLKKTSRSFYLSLRILPDGMRAPVALAYLLARAADTIADTELVPAPLRLQLLATLREAIASGRHAETAAIHRLVAPHGKPEEKALLEALPSLLAQLERLGKNDRDPARKVLDTLLSGMAFDLETFPAEDAGIVKPLASMEELDRYTYLVAGCVGEFWTDTMLAHVAGMEDADRTERIRLGVRFGKALQMTNILRDCARDLRIGRCYLPQPLLECLHLEAPRLLQARSGDDARPALHQLTRLTLDHFRAAVDYTIAIPPRHLRLRLACLWPIVIGLETLLALAGNPHWLDPACPSKIPRARVYRILLVSLPRAGSDKAIRRWAQELIARIEEKLPPSDG